MPEVAPITIACIIILLYLLFMISSVLLCIRFHTSVFHLVTIVIILLAFAHKWFSESYANNSRARHAPLHRSIKGIHVFRKETLANGLERVTFFSIVSNNLCLAKCYCRLELQGKATILGTHHRLAFAHSAKAYEGICPQYVQILSHSSAMKIKSTIICTSQ